MTVKDLIEALEKYDGDAPVFADMQDFEELKFIEKVSMSLGTWRDNKTDRRYKCPVLKIEE